MKCDTIIHGGALPGFKTGDIIYGVRNVKKEPNMILDSFDASCGCGHTFDRERDYLCVSLSNGGLVVIQKAQAVLMKQTQVAKFETA